MKVMSQNSSAPANGFVELPDMNSLDRFLAQSNGSPVVIFKHSNLCGISARAHAELSGIELPIGLVTVQTARDVSNEIETRTGVEHQTPQIFILRDGKVLWSASHGRITAASVAEALAAAGQSTVDQDG
jgi:bacillithiol system protein YtxJ